MITSSMLSRLLSDGPFLIEMTDGRKYEIRNPDSIFVGQSSARIEPTGACDLCDPPSFEQISLHEIDNIKPLDRRTSWTIRKIQLQNELRPTEATDYLLVGVAAYLYVSILTVPFAGIVWIGELPVLALFQLPVVKFAGWLRIAVVMQLIKMFGMSAGSFSPDYIVARPYGMFLCCIVPALIVSTMMFQKRHLHRPQRRWAIIVICLMFINGLMILRFGKSPWNGFTMY